MKTRWLDVHAGEPFWVEVREGMDDDGNKVWKQAGDCWFTDASAVEYEQKEAARRIARWKVDRAVKVWRQAQNALLAAQEQIYRMEQCEKYGVDPY